MSSNLRITLLTVFHQVISLFTQQLTLSLCIIRDILQAVIIHPYLVGHLKKTTLSLPRKVRRQVHQFVLHHEPRDA
jgi:hypothetical protein